MLQRLLPEEPEGAGLLALVLLTAARRPARLDPAGDLVCDYELGGRVVPGLLQSGSFLFLGYPSLPSAISPRSRQ